MFIVPLFLVQATCDQVFNANEVPPLLQEVPLEKANLVAIIPRTHPLKGEPPIAFCRNDIIAVSLDVEVGRTHASSVKFPACIAKSAKLGAST